MPKKIFESENLYHFTTFESALKILLSNTLLFGKYRDMNDINESMRILYGGLYNKNKIEELENKENEIEKYQQLSFTMDIDSINKGFELSPMWGHYADKGRGVCLVFDKNILISLLPQGVQHGKIEYTNDTSNFKDLEADNVLKEIFFKKFMDWKYENEYRIILTSNSLQRERLDIKDLLKGIITLFDGDNKEMLKKLNIEIPIFHYTCLAGHYSLISDNEHYSKHDEWEDIKE